jgi:hypothetical protein
MAYRFVASLPQHANIQDNDITLKRPVGRGSRGMVEIIQDSVVPNTQSVVPSIKLTIKQTMNYNDALLRLLAQYRIGVFITGSGSSSYNSITVDYQGGSQGGDVILW